MKLNKLLSLIIAISMILSVMPATGVFAADDAVEELTAFDTKTLTISGEQSISKGGWTEKSNVGTLAVFNQNWKNGVWGSDGTGGNYALTFFRSIGGGGANGDSTIEVTLDNAIETLGTQKLSIDFDLALMDNSNYGSAAKSQGWGGANGDLDVYQTWTYKDYDGNDIARFAFDINVGGDCGDGKVSYANTSTIMSMQGKHVKITATKEEDGYNVEYYVDSKLITSEKRSNVNGFGSVHAFIGSYNDQWGGAGMENLKITYVPRSGKADVTLVLKYGDKTEEKNIVGLFSGDSFTPNEEQAPKLIVDGRDLYANVEPETFNVKAGENRFEVTYTETEVESVVLAEGQYEAIAGNIPNFPKSLTCVVPELGETELAVEWITDEDLDALEEAKEVNYTAVIPGYKETVGLSAMIYPCDHAIGTAQNPTFWHSGNNSDSPNFGSNNPLGYAYRGTLVNEFDFTINSGGNMLIMYGNVGDLSGFGAMGALIRLMQSGSNVEYYNGSWTTASGLSVKYKTPYRIKTVINTVRRKYSMYLSENGGEYKTVCQDASFRNQNLVEINRMFTTGDITSISHRTYWQEGYSVVTVNRTLADGTSVDSFETKYASGTTYVYNDSQPVIAAGGKLYIRDNADTKPSVVVDGDTTLDIVYRPIEVAETEAAEASLIEGEATVTMPSYVKVKFSDGQTIKYGATWDTSAVNTAVSGDYSVSGTIPELCDMAIEGVVHVKTVTMLPKSTENTVATNNGGWNWYVEPSGTHIQPGDSLAQLYQSGAYTTGGYEFVHDRTYMGWVEDDGDIVIAQYDHDTDEYTRVEIHEKLESDDHNNPAVVVLPDGRIMAVYSMHTNEPYMYYRVTKNPEDITEWNAEQFYLCRTSTDSEADSYYNATYPTVFMVHDDEGIAGNDTIYMGWRGVHWKPTMAKFSMPDENGVCYVKMGQTQFANTSYSSKEDGGRGDGGRRPYTKYDYDSERNKIYITFTSNHPDNDNNNHVYYLYLDIEDQNLYTASGRYLQPLPRENQAVYKSQGAVVNGANTNGQWGVVTDNVVGEYPELFIFNANEQLAQGGGERRGWTWDISHNEKGEPCVVYVDVTATPPGEGGTLPEAYRWEQNGNTRSHHYYWYARWDSDAGTWVKTFLTYGGKWWHENATQERCYSGGLTFDHNAADANVIFLSIPTMGEYGNMFEIFRWESDDHGATWTIREPITENSKACNARPNAIYNYKQNDDGSNAGPRLLWIQGEYRYWMNYEYKTGVMTDFAADGFITQDDPQMFADAALYMGGEKLDAIPVGEANVTGKFNITNISIGDGKVLCALAHYNKDNMLVGLEMQEEDIPARSVPQTGILGAPLREDGSLSRMGDDEIKLEVEYAADFAEGDRIALMAWNMGVQYPLTSIMRVPFDMTTEGDSYVYKETFTYDGDDVLYLNDDENNYNGWIGHRYYSERKEDCIPDSYAGIIKAPFGNTALHLYHRGDGGVMASHSIPNLPKDKDYEISFSIRYINEWSWNNTANAGFSLAHGMPNYANDIATASCAFQFRHGSAWGQENGRGNTGYVRRTRWFDGNNLDWFFMNDIPRRMNTDGMDRISYVDNGNGNNVGYYDPKTQTYIHDYDDSLMVGALYQFKVRVSPTAKTVTMSLNDGYRTVTKTENFVDVNSYDWDNNPIDTIIFNVGNDKWGEMYVDDIAVKVIEN